MYYNYTSIGSCVLIPAYKGLSFKLAPEFFNFKGAQDRFQGIDSASLCSLAGRYDNPIPTRFLVPIDCSKIPA